MMELLAIIGIGNLITVVGYFMRLERRLTRFEQCPHVEVKE